MGLRPRNYADKATLPTMATEDAALVAALRDHIADLRGALFEILSGQNVVAGPMGPMLPPIQFPKGAL